MPDAESKTHPGSMDKDFYDVANKVTDMARTYNAWAASAQGLSSWEERYAYVPESYEQIQQFNRGEWDDENLPLTKSAQREVDFVKKYKDSGGMEGQIANL
jgi:hypothetical protein